MAKLSKAWKFWKVGVEFIAKLSLTSGVHYIAVPKRLREFYDLKSGDLLKVKILEAKREVFQEEEY